MAYSIGEVSKLTNITVSALRYYDREGLFPNISRSEGGIRVFTDSEVDTLRMIECLKMTDMPIKDIKQFLDWCEQGDCTLELRREMFYERLEAMNEKMAELQRTINTIKFKCWFYDTAVQYGTDSAPRNMPLEDMPEEIQEYQRAVAAEKEDRKRLTA